MKLKLMKIEMTKSQRIKKIQQKEYNPLLDNALSKELCNSYIKEQNRFVIIDQCQQQSQIQHIHPHKVSSWNWSNISYHEQCRIKQKDWLIIWHICHNS